MNIAMILEMAASNGDRPAVTAGLKAADVGLFGINEAFAPRSSRP
jgi:hypothetical protein